MTHVPDVRSMSFLAEAQYLRELKWAGTVEDEERETCLRRLLRGNAERACVHPNQWLLSLAKHARDRLVQINQPLVVHHARFWMSVSRVGQGFELLDLVQEGNLSLIEALDVCCVDDLRDIPFIRYISRAIHRGIGRVCKREDRHPVESLQAHLFDDEQEEDLNFTGLYTSYSAAARTRQEELSMMLCQAFDVVLTAEQRDVIELRYGVSREPVAGHAPFEVADILHLARSTVASREKVCYRRLAAALHPVVLESGQVVYELDEAYQDEYYTIAEAAQFLGVPEYRLNYWVRRGELTYEVRYDSTSSSVNPIRVFSSRALLALVQSGAAGSVASARLSALLPSVVA